MSLACAVKEKGRPVIIEASQVIVVVSCAKCACRCRTSGAPSTRSARARARKRSRTQLILGHDQKDLRVKIDSANANLAARRVPPGLRRRVRRKLGRNG